MAASDSSQKNEVEPVEPVQYAQYIDREHTTSQYVFISVGLSLCIFVDIFQYSMPLAFLPSVLEDRGHSPMKIATAIGIYYWTGFLGGLCITSYQIWRTLYVEEEGHEVTPFRTVQLHIKYLIIGLFVSTITLFVQALNPCWTVHTSCRFIQGFVGAYIFFYAFLLCVACFKGQQQVTAMTLASCAVVIAEVFGSFLGAVVFDMYGQGAVFWFLGLVSFVNQGYLVAILCMVRSVSIPSPSPPSRFRTPRSSLELKEEVRTCTPEWWYPQHGAVAKLTELCYNRSFVCANLLITMAAVIKGSVEEMLPFHGDHQWGYDPLAIGQLFCTIAVAYMAAAAIVCQSWSMIGRFQVGCSSVWLAMYGVSAWLAWSVAYYYKDHMVLSASLGLYGFCCGLTFTAASQLIADVIDHEEGSFKEAANGIWNATWEAGGSLGFFLGGLLAEHYDGQLTLLSRYLVCSIITALCMIAVAFWPEKEACPESKTMLSFAYKKDCTPIDYGTSA